MNERNEVLVEQAASPLELNPRRVLGWVVAVLAVLGAWFWWNGAEERAIRRLPAAERAALYQRELASFESMCMGDPATALDAECRHRATILSWLPECTAECTHLISKVIPVGSPPHDPAGSASP
ncbi:MAG: hypothetical protein U0610_29630 [bacterium]